MKIIELFSEEDLCKSVVDGILDFIKLDVRVNIALFSGSTSIPIYDLLVNKIKNKPIPKNIHFYIHNEIPLLPAEKGGLVMNHINKYFFSRVNVDVKNIHLLNENNYRQLESEISTSGGIDLIILSVGDDGHISANYPGAEIFTGIRKINISKKSALYKTLRKNEKSKNLVTPHFYSYGIGTILESKNIFVVAYGKNKKGALNMMKDGITDVMCPVSLLNEHHACTLYTLIDDLTSVRQ